MIVFDIGGRQTGKSARMIERTYLLLDQDSPVERGQFISFGELAGWGGSGRIACRRERVVIGIDNLDRVLDGLLGFAVARVNATGDLAGADPPPKE